MTVDTPGPPPPKRFVLAGVPRVGFGVTNDRCPESIPFPSCLRACMEYLGENYGALDISEYEGQWRVDRGYTLLLGMSGCAFWLSWGDGWQADNIDITHMSEVPDAPHVRAFEAAGYGFDWVVREEGEENPELFRARIVESIYGRRRPVLAFGVIGPPECCVVTGYDDGGEVLIGWNYYQDLPEYTKGLEFEPTGEFRKRDWYAAMDCLAIIGARHEKLPVAVLYRRALEWAIYVARNPHPWPDRSNGLAAYDAWAAALQRDEDFPANDLPLLMRRHAVHDDAVGMVAECRWYAAQFLTDAAAQFPGEGEHLMAAAECYEAEHDITRRIWMLVGGTGRTEYHALRFANPSVRREIVPMIQAARRKDAEAVEHLEKALAALCPPHAE